MNLQIDIEQSLHRKPLPPEDTFGFGRFFSDHMFVSEYSTLTGWHNLRVTPYQPISLDPGAAVLHYGQALFEGMKAFRGTDGVIRLFRPEKNWGRLVDGATRLCMEAPPFEIFMEGLQRLLDVDRSWIPKKAGTALYIRPTLIGTEAFLGVRPSDHYIFYIITSPVGNYYGENIETVKIWVEEEFSRCAPGGIGSVKAGGNYAASLQAATEAKKRGFAQVLWLDSSEKKFIEEVGTMNVFFNLNGTVVTPPLSGTILPGVMRDSTIQVLRSLGKTVEERPVTISEIYKAHADGSLIEIFGTGTAAGISPVGLLGTRDGDLHVNGGKVGPLASELYTYFQDLNYGRREDLMGWMKEV